MAAPMVVEYVISYIAIVFLLSTGQTSADDIKGHAFNASASRSNTIFSAVFEPLYGQVTSSHKHVEEHETEDPVEENEFCEDPSMLDYCGTLTFLDIILGIEPGSTDQIINYMKVTPAIHTVFHTSIHAESRPRIVCLPHTRTESDVLQVKIVNSTSLLQSLGNKNDSFFHCAVVMFYAPWCMFCARVAPSYNALARAFPQLDVLAIDAVHFSSLNSRYGTIAVPNILVFYNNSRAVAKFNHTERTFEKLVDYVSNITGFKANASVTVLPEDYEGPLPSLVSNDRDWLLWLSWAFMIVFFGTLFGKSNTGQTLWTFLNNFGIEHQQHID